MSHIKWPLHQFKRTAWFSAVPNIYCTICYKITMLCCVLNVLLRSLCCCFVLKLHVIVICCYMLLVPYNIGVQITVPQYWEKSNKFVEYKTMSITSTASCKSLSITNPSNTRKQEKSVKNHIHLHSCIIAIYAKTAKLRKVCGPIKPRWKRWNQTWWPINDCDGKLLENKFYNNNSGEFVPHLISHFFNPGFYMQLGYFCIDVISS